MDILNSRFDLSTDDAAALWNNATLAPSIEDFPVTARLSSNGDWVVKHRTREVLVANNTAKLLGAALCEATALELRRLQGTGQQVISYALTPGEDNTSVYAVTPYIPDLVECDRKTFGAVVAPRVHSYYRQIQSFFIETNARLGIPYLEDLESIRQYKIMPGRPQEAFLHDVDPYMQHDATFLAEQLRRLSQAAVHGSLAV